MVDNSKLLRAGLELMRRNGQPLTKQPGFGRSMRYLTPTGESVRVRTCNDHILIVLAGDPDPDKAKLNIEGTDWLLIVMLETQRTAGKAMAYLVPTGVAVEAARRCHRQWLSSKPKTGGSNTTFNLWFDEGGNSAGFAEHWKQYLLPGTVDTEQLDAIDIPPSGNIKNEVEMARQRIASAAGVSVAAVRITVDFGGVTTP